MDLVREVSAVRTRGFKSLGRRELVAAVSSPELLSDAEDYLEMVCDYLLSSGAELKHGETMAYGYWLTKFVATDDHLEAWEYAADASHFVPGITLTLTYWRSQHRVCQRLSAEFQPPRPDQVVVVSEGVLEGDQAVQGVRYPSPEHMSGWWFTTDRYRGDVGSLVKIHAYHLSAARPDLSSLLALPHGYRFDLSKSEDIWYDEKVALQADGGPNLQ